MGKNNVKGRWEGETRREGGGVRCGKEGAFIEDSVETDPAMGGGVCGAPEDPRVTNKVFPALSHGGQSYFKGILKGAVP